jgi:hypothetical protein
MCVSNGDSLRSTALSCGQKSIAPGIQHWAKSCLNGRKVHPS